MSEPLVLHTWSGGREKWPRDYRLVQRDDGIAVEWGSLGRWQELMHFEHPDEELPVLAELSRLASVAARAAQTEAAWEQAWVRNGGIGRALAARSAELSSVADALGDLARTLRVLDHSPLADGAHKAEGIVRGVITSLFGMARAVAPGIETASSEDER